LQTQSRDVRVNGELLKARVFDTSGLERYQAATFPYYSLASCVAVAYSVTDPASFDHVEKWIRTLEAHGDGLACHMLLATKADLEEERAVSADEGRALARNLGLGFFETSAKTSQNVEDAFASMAMTAQLRMLELQDKARSSGQCTFSPLELQDKARSSELQALQPAAADSRVVRGGRSVNRKSARGTCGCRVQPAPGLCARVSAHS